MSDHRLFAHILLQTENPPFQTKSQQSIFFFLNNNVCKVALIMLLVCLKGKLSLSVNALSASDHSEDTQNLRGRRLGHTSSGHWIRSQQMSCSPE